LLFKNHVNRSSAASPCFAWEEKQQLVINTCCAQLWQACI